MLLTPLEFVQTLLKLGCESLQHPFRNLLLKGVYDLSHNRNRPSFYNPFAVRRMLTKIAALGFNIGNLTICTEAWQMSKEDRVSPPLGLRITGVAGL